MVTEDALPAEPEIAPKVNPETPQTEAESNAIVEPENAPIAEPETASEADPETLSTVVEGSDPTPPKSIKKARRFSRKEK